MSNVSGIARDIHRSRLSLSTAPSSLPLPLLHFRASFWSVIPSDLVSNLARYLLLLSFLLRPNVCRALSQGDLDHIGCSPPVISLCAGAEGFTEVFSVVELDSSKIKRAITGNATEGMFSSIFLEGCLVFLLYGPAPQASGHPFATGRQHSAIPSVITPLLSPHPAPSALCTNNNYHLPLSFLSLNSVRLRNRAPSPTLSRT